ncbi:O-antigen ligase family protein [uncultured Prevotella sp.]|uniref:O-antigen ligase family protein n=1 Tax=uncultured Prevotella sp. TaxID=159272 RepID=UPI002625FFED|nr:O-antigen ligase family protein [uncultured Prevotella sp.]
MLQIIFVFLVVIYSLFVKDCRKIILLLLVLLPFNNILKTIFMHNGGDSIFSFWKEISIIILFFRVHLIKREKQVGYINNKLIGTYIFIVFYFFIFFIIGSGIFGASMAFRTFRNVAFLPILLFIFPSLVLDDIFKKKFLMSLMFSATLMGLFGVVECHLGFREAIRGYMGQIEEIGSDGTIYYNTTNLKIMGFDRMAGLIGTPNDFGNYMALSASMIYYFIRRKIIEYKHNEILWISFIFIILCLIESFCRTAFAMFLLIIILTEYKSKNNVLKNVIAISVASLLILYIATLVNDSVNEILSATFSGNEASSADRGNNFKRGIDFLVANPFGYGLGSTENSLKNYVFFSESSFLNLGVEAGVFAIILFLFFCKIINKVLYVHNNELSIYSSSVVITNSICFLFASIFGTPYIYIFWIFTCVGLMKSSSNINNV